MHLSRLGRRLIPIASAALITATLPALAQVAPFKNLKACEGGAFSTEEDFMMMRGEPFDGNPYISDGDLLSPGGDVCARNAELLQRFDVKDDLGLFYRHTGPSLSPFNAWLLLKGLETLELRVERQCRTAAAIACYLETHPKITRVLYPGLPSHPQYELACRQMKQGGGLVCFDVAGDKAACFRFLDALRLVDISNNLGDSKSLVTHPATTTHSRLKPEQRAELGIGDSLVRLSAGLEAEADLLDDIEQALKKV